MKKILSFAFIATVILTLASCKEEARYLPSATGKPGEIVIVASSDLWNSNVGDSLRKTFGVEDTLLPQAEPRFSMVQISPNNFSNMFRIHRNIIIVEMDKKQKAGGEVSSKTDNWASAQTVIYINGANKEDIIEQLHKKANTILDIFEKAELARITRSAKMYENAALREAVEKKYGYTLCFPQDYEMLGDKDKFMWIGLRTTKRTQGIFIYSYPYTSQDQLSADSLIAKRNAVLKHYVLLDKEPQGSAWMTTATYIKPSYQKIMNDEQFIVRIRGLWEVENDFMGGPFISYTTIDKKQNRVITFDGFVYAPSRTKRDLLRQVEGIIMAEKPIQ